MRKTFSWELELFSRFEISSGKSIRSFKSGPRLIHFAIKASSELLISSRFSKFLFFGRWLGPQKWMEIKISRRRLSLLSSFSIFVRVRCYLSIQWIKCFSLRSFLCWVSRCGELLHWLADGELARNLFLIIKVNITVRNTIVGEFPSFVGIVLPIGNQVCGAAILNPNHVLTVANCMLNANNLLLAPNQISILFGANVINFNNPRIQVQAIYVHPQYSPFTFANDIAVVRSMTDFNFPIAPVPLTAITDISTRIGERKFLENLLNSIDNVLDCSIRYAKL